MVAHAIATPKFRYAQPNTKTERVKGVFVTYLIVLILLSFTCCLFYIWSRIQIVNVGYEINRELSSKEKLAEENKRLSMEVATLKSPVRLEALAKNEYHMDLPQKSQILSEASSKILEVSPVLAPKETTAKLKTSDKAAAKTLAKAPAPAKVGKNLKKTQVASAPKKNAVSTLSTALAKKAPASPAQKAALPKAQASGGAPVEKAKPKAVLSNSKVPASKSSVAKVASTAGENPPH